ncbi:MAG: TRAP transporter fused permease subunit [Burkholderiaceae bacterium]
MNDARKEIGIDDPEDGVAAEARSAFGRTLRAIGLVVAALLAIHAIYVAYVGQYLAPEIIRAGVLWTCALIVTFTSPLAAELPWRNRAVGALAWCIDLAMLAVLAFACWNFLHKIDDIENLVVQFSPWDQASALIAIIVLLELSRRAFGLILSAVGVIALLYCLFGQDLPWIFRHSGFSLELSMEIIWFGLQGVFGFATGIVVLLILVFIVFGALLEGSGAGATMIRMALAATGGTRGGPAHAAVVASSIFGMSSGSVTANVVGTGVVTIPLIKQRGFSPAFAAAVEATASTGGQLMPPVMGAAAFLMTQLVGQPYQMIALAALVPALFYYGSLFVAIGQEARRLGLEPTPRDQRQKLEPGDKPRSLIFFGPLAAIIITLAMGRSPSMAGFWACITTIVMALILNPELRAKPAMLLAALAKGGVAGARIMMAVGAIGILLAVFELTGLGLKFATQVALIGDTTLFVALILAAASCLVLGMGMPTLPAYMIIVLVLGLGMKKLGLPDLSVHMFVFYFGVLSAITPPVALAAVAAAPIAGAEPVRTGLASMRLALVGFIVPFFFVYEPSLLLVMDDFTIQAFVWAAFRLAFAVWLLTTAMSGFEREKLTPLSRGLRVIAGFAMLMVMWEVQLPAIALGAFVLAADRGLLRRRSAGMAG